MKLTGYPRVSQIRRAPVSALGDWIMCLRSDAESDPRTYALLIQNNDIVDYRLALMIDGCVNERFEPLPTQKFVKWLRQAAKGASQSPVRGSRKINQPPLSMRSPWIRVQIHKDLGWRALPQNRALV